MATDSQSRAGIHRQYETEERSAELAQSSPAQTERSLYGEPETFRDLLREIIYGSPNHKSIAIELFGAEKVGNSYSRLAHALQPKEPGVPSNNFDVDWIETVARELTPAARMRLAWWFLSMLGIEPGGPRSLVFKRKETLEERLAALEEKIARDADEQREAVRELRELREDAAAESNRKVGRR